MKHLITGGAGFIGSNTAEYFAKKGDEVIIFDNMSRKGSQANLAWLQSTFPKLEVIEADITKDTAKLTELAQQVDVIIHLAGQVAVTTSVEDPRADFEANALGTFNVLEAARKAKNPPIVLYSSTNKVYGGMHDVEIIETEEAYAYKNFPEGIDEMHNLDFHSPYGCSKGAADQYVRDYARIYDLKTVVFRQSCIYGPRQFGIEDQGWVAWFIIAALTNQPITVFGDGKQIRDVLYVNDLIKAYELAIKNIDQVTGEIFNTGGGPENTLSLLQLIGEIEAHHGKKLEYSFADWRPGDQKVYVSNTKKIEFMLGWRAETTVEAGIEQLYAWVKANLNLFK